MNTHELAKLLLSAPPGEIECSVDISTGEHDAGRRVFGSFTDVNYLPTEGNKFFSSNHAMLLFEGSLND